MDKKKYIAFISYSRKDLNMAKSIKEKIENITGEICWMDLDGIESGEDFINVIISAIDNSNYFIFLLSNNSMVSKYTQKEITYAEKIGKKIIPLNIDKCTPKGWYLFNFGSIDVINIHIREQLEKFYSNIKTWCSEKDKKNSYPIFFKDEFGRGKFVYLLFLVDCSGSMYGERIETFNIALDSVIKNLDIINPDTEILFNVLQFSCGCHWTYGDPVKIESIKWWPIDANGSTDLGSACCELNNALSKDRLFSNKNNYSGFMPSIIFLITDGFPTDDYLPNIENLWNNPYFKISKKFAIGIGDEAPSDVLTSFTRNKKSVFIVHNENLNELSPIINRLLTMSLYSVSMSSLDDD